LPIGIPALGLQVDGDEPVHIRVGQIQREPAGLTRPARLPVLDRPLTNQALRQPQGDALLADPRRPLEQEGLRQPAAGHGVAQTASQGVVPVKGV
jgi:hypothetical protein